MEGLKPCLFCGGEARIKTWEDRWGNWNAQVYCINVYGKPKEEKCQADFFMRTGTKEEVIEKITAKWNTRPNPWYTSIPTKEGWYLIKFVIGKKGEEEVCYRTENYKYSPYCTFKNMEWQKIEATE